MLKIMIHFFDENKFGINETQTKTYDRITENPMRGLNTRTITALDVELNAQYYS